jgi:hypothetical protein
MVPIRSCWSSDPGQGFPWPVTALRPAVFVLLVAFILGLGVPAQARRQPKVNYFYEEGALFDAHDPLGDDKGPGYYQYPLDQRLRRGTFDLRRFSVYEEGNVYVFVIQTREYIMTAWPDTRAGEDQGFVALMVDIYIDRDGLPRTGYRKALPGRDLEFADERGWEKMILVTPLSQFRAYDILKSKTDDLSLQDMLDDVILPDYVIVQRDKLIIRLSKDLVGPLTDRSGFQCMIMGFSHVVSPNRLLNRDVRAFPTQQDFGGGADTYGDPVPIDLLMPEGVRQYDVLREFRSEPFRSNITYAAVPFLYGTSGAERSSVSADAAMVPGPRQAATVTPVRRPLSGHGPAHQTPTVVPTTNAAPSVGGFRPISQSKPAASGSFKPLRPASIETVAPSSANKTGPSPAARPTTFIPIKPVTSKGLGLD